MLQGRAYYLGELVCWFKNSVLDKWTRQGSVVQERGSVLFLFFFWPSSHRCFKALPDWNVWRARGRETETSYWIAATKSQLLAFWARTLFCVVLGLFSQWFSRSSPEASLLGPREQRLAEGWQWPPTVGLRPVAPEHHCLCLTADSQPHPELPNENL